MPFELLYKMPPIGHMDWIGFRKMDPRPTLLQPPRPTSAKSTNILSTHN